MLVKFFNSSIHCIICLLKLNDYANNIFLTFKVAKGVTPIGPSDYVPIIKSTVTYIVLVVLVNSDDEVLMMQEAKSTCAGQWYLPAGRVEPGEDLHVS